MEYSQLLRYDSLELREDAVAIIHIDVDANITANTYEEFLYMNTEYKHRMMNDVGDKNGPKKIRSLLVGLPLMPFHM